MSLLPRQKRFADLYLTYNNAAKAYREAGYKDTKNARCYAHELLKHEDIKIYIEEQINNIRSKDIATRHEVLEMLTKAMRGELEEEVVIPFSRHNELIKKKIGIKDRLKAAELLAKRYGLLTENINLQAEIRAEYIATWGEEIEVYEQD